MGETTKCEHCGEDLSDAIRDGMTSQHRCDPVRVSKAAFARGVEAAAACLTGLEDLVGEFSAVEIRCRIRALALATDAKKET